MLKQPCTWEIKSNRRSIPLHKKPPLHFIYKNAGAPLHYIYKIIYYIDFQCFKISFFFEKIVVIIMLWELKVKSCNVRGGAEWCRDIKSKNGRQLLSLIYCYI